MWVLHHGEWRPASWNGEGEVGGAGERGIALPRVPWETSALDSRDGWQTRLREVSLDTPVILMSGHPGEALGELSTLGDQVTFLQQPFGPATLLSAIDAQRRTRVVPSVFEVQE